MRLRIGIGVLSVLAAAAAIFVLAAGGGGGGGLDPVAQAADATTHAGGARIALSGSVSVPGLSQPITITGQGAFNFAAAEGQLSMRMGGFPASVTAKLNGAPLEMNELFKSSEVYIGSPLFAGKLPNGARWMRLNLAKFQQAAGLDPSSLTSGGVNPALYLAYLRGAGGASKVVGHDTVRDVATTHYAGSMDLLKAAEAQPGADRSKLRDAFRKLIEQTGLRKVPVDVWVDSHGLVRRFSIAISLSASGQPAKATITTEYFDFGPTPAIKVPGDSEVFDMTAQALGSLATGG